MVEPIRTWKVYIDMQEGKKSDAEAAGRRTGRDRQSCVKMGEWKNHSRTSV